MIDATLTDQLDDVDRRLLNRCQEGFPVTDRPFRALADQLELTEEALLVRLRRMVEEGLLSRFGAIFLRDFALEWRRLLFNFVFWYVHRIILFCGRDWKVKCEEKNGQHKKKTFHLNHSSSCSTFV